MPHVKQLRAGLLLLAGVSLALTVSGCSKAPVSAAPDSLQELVASKWGADSVLLSSSTQLVQYEADLGERWVVDFESGSVLLESLWPADKDLNGEDVRDCMSCAVSNIFVREPVFPEDMLRAQKASGYVPAASRSHELKRKGDDWVYTVRKGDTLSGIAMKLRVRVDEIMKANALRDPHRIKAGQALVIPELLPHVHMEGDVERQRAVESLLAGQLSDPETGDVIDLHNLDSFSRKIVAQNGVEHSVAVGADGRTRGVSRVRFTLVEKHLQVRAKKYYPAVKEYAEQFGHDPAVIMAMIHTESAFNPMAKSPSGAYGLMQIVPSSGGREAYRWLHSKDEAPSRSDLMKPNRNIELGAAYMQVLQEKVFKGVKEADSRLYCSVAAYNGGGGNVARAMTGQKSVQKSLVAINAITPEQVFKKLQSDAPHQETRDYVQRVFDRSSLYRAPAWDEAG